MQKIVKRGLALLLCAVLALGAMSLTPSQAQEAPAPQGQSDYGPLTVYGKAGETTFVPAGYTYVYEEEDGSVYTREAARDMYISQRVLTPQEAEALAGLEGGETRYLTAEDGSVLQCQDFDAQEAAQYSQAVREILGDAPLDQGEEISLRSEVYTQESWVKAMVIFEDAPVASMESMSVRLGQPLGQAEQTAMARIAAQQAVQTQALEKKLGYDLQVSDHFTLLTNAISVTVQYGDLQKLNRQPGVKAAFLMPAFSVPESEAPVVQSASQFLPNMHSAGPAMGATGAWDLGYQGEGMSVAILDTGLSYENPSFIQEPQDQSRVAYTKEDIAAILEANELHAEALSEETSLDTVYYSGKVPFGFNYADGLANFGTDDDTGLVHGTHVAGIVAGNLPEEVQEQLHMETLGIAPEAQLIIMKVFDMDGMCYFDYLIAAMEDAIVLGVDCANLSLGSACGPHYYEGMTEVYDAAREAGIHVVVAAGNDASTGYRSLWGEGLVESSSVSTGTLGMPGTFDSVLTVASMENPQEVSFEAIRGLSTVSWYNRAQGFRQFFAYQEAESVPEGMGFQERLAGQFLTYATRWEDAEGKLMFAPFEGGNADGIMAQAVQAKAAAVVLYSPTVTEELPAGMPVHFSLTRFEVPMAATSRLQYDFIWSNLPDKDLLRVDTIWNPSQFAGQMSSFSSWGPTDGLTLKPEITGIGGNVFSAYVGNDYAVASGTSMASPAVAASAALVRQYLRESGVAEEQLPHMVNCLLMSTATPVRDEEHDTLYFVRRQGAGLANAALAMASGAYIQVEGTDKAKLELGDDPDRTGSYTMDFQVVNFSDADKTYRLDTTVLGQTAQGGQFKHGKVTYLVSDYARELDAAVTSSAADGTITVPANSTAKVSVTVTLSDADKAYMDERFPYGSYVEGFVQLLSEDNVTLSVPFLAFYGDFGEGPVLEEGTYDTLLGGVEYGYTTADQFHNSLWGTRPVYDSILGLSKNTTFYLGDTCVSDWVRVPAEDSIAHVTTSFYPETAGFSPNQDGSLDLFQLGLGLKRNAENIHYTVTDRATGEVLWEQDTGFVSKTYYSDNAGGVLYAGSSMDEALSYEWLFASTRNEEGYISYDWDHCLLAENTWVDIQAEITPEYQRGGPNANNTVSFSLYIDNSGPFQAEDISLYVEEMNTPFGTHKIYFYNIPCSEKWFPDYSISLDLRYNESTGQWGGSGYSAMYDGSPLPMYLDSASMSATFSHGTNRIDDCDKVLDVAIDCAGNTSVAVFEQGEAMGNYVNLAAEKTILDPGETLTIRNTAENQYDMQIEWTNNNPEILEILESDGYSCTIRALAPGAASVSGGFGPYAKSLDITVRDPERERIAGQYPDIANHWAREEIITAIQEGLFRGTGANTFSPETALTRGQLVTVLHRLAGTPEATGSSFQDVVEGRYYTEAVAWAKETGLVKGVTPERFCPNSPVTREQFAAILYRYAQLQGQDVSNQADLSAYLDAGKLSHYAQSPMAWAVAEGLIRGVSETALCPKASSTRAQAAVILVRYLTWEASQTA